MPPDMLGIILVSCDAGIVE